MTTKPVAAIITTSVLLASCLHGVQSSAYQESSRTKSDKVTIEVGDNVMPKFGADVDFDEA